MLLVFSFNDFIQIQKISTAGQYAFDILTGLLRDEICCNGMSKVYMKVINVSYEPYHEKDFAYVKTKALISFVFTYSNIQSFLSLTAYCKGMGTYLLSRFSTLGHAIWGLLGTASLRLFLWVPKIGALDSISISFLTRLSQQSLQQRKSQHNT